jgi:hypothetical protein
MISLKEIIHSIKSDKETNLVPLDDWKISETDYLSDIGFKPNGESSMGLENPPMLAYRKKEGFCLKDGKLKQSFTFGTFDEMVNHFDKYQQDLKNR